MSKSVNIAIDAMSGENSPKKIIDGFLPDPTIKAVPIDRGQQNRGKIKKRSGGNRHSANKNVWAGISSKNSGDKNNLGHRK